LKKAFLFFVVAAAVTLNMLNLPAIADTVTPAQTVTETKASDFVQLLYKGDFSDAEAMFDATMKSALTTDALKSDWDSIVPRLGDYNGTITTQSSEVQGYDVVTVTTGHEFYNLFTSVTFDTDGTVAGLHFIYTVNDNLKPTTYIQNGIKEIHFDLVSGQYKLPAILTLPAKANNLPAVVLVSGSGPNDRDETVGAEKPFKDIAEDLAKKGIASLRYDKRTFAYQAQIEASGGNISIDEEYTQDAASAVNYLTGFSGINKTKVFLLGHSEAGMLAPRISLSTPTVAGVILLAGSPRRFEDIIVDQTALLDPSELSEAKAEAAEAKKLDNTAQAPNETLFGVPASYIKDLDSQDAAIDAIKSGKPMLILQGERDAQVFMTDFNLWKQKLSSLSDVTYKSYPKLNHLFIEGSGAPNVQEYNTAGHVASYVINDIADFVTSPPVAHTDSGGKVSSTTSSSAPRNSGSSQVIPNPSTGGGNETIPIGAVLLLISCATIVLTKRYK
jgi:dienelactone hydrolase